MAIPLLRLNLAPHPTVWRQYHQVLGWLSLGVGALALGAVLTLSARAYWEASREGKNAVMKTDEAQKAIQDQQAILARLQTIEVEKELPVWKLAERILTERSHPWSRLTSELERCMVQDVRIRSIMRTRNAAQATEIKVVGEAKSREAEEALVASIYKNPFFSQIILGKEGERQGGGIDFEFTLVVSSNPPAYEALPKYGPARGPKTPELPGKGMPGKAAAAGMPSPPPPAPGKGAPPKMPLPPSGKQGKAL